VIKEYGEKIDLQVLDKDTLKSDLVGEVTLNVDDLCHKGGVREAWYHIVFHRRIKALGDKEAGKIKISSKYVDINEL
jgi:Ca2+-dependent lipid-binding protein